MGTNLSCLTVLWKFPCKVEERNEEKLATCIAQSRQYLPEFSNRQEYKKFYDKYKHAMGASVPKGMLKHMYKVLTKDARLAVDVEHDERILKYCLSKGDLDLWPNLRSANNGAEERYTVFSNRLKK